MHGSKGRRKREKGEREWNKSQTKAAVKKKKKKKIDVRSRVEAVIFSKVDLGAGVSLIWVMLTVLRWSEPMLEWLGPACQNERRSARSRAFPRAGARAGVSRGVVIVSPRRSSGAAEVKLSAAVAAHSTPLQYIHTVLYQCCACSPLPLPLPLPPPP